jgi:hypothetical protein
MSPLFPRPRYSVLRTLALLALAAEGCRDADRHPVPPPPAAEFVLAAGDSSFWVTSAAGAIRVRGAPLSLARVNGRFYEVYVTDDDRSYGDAILVGQRIYRRDLVSGDSLLVFQDTVVPRVARLYGRLHPDDDPLRPSDEPSMEPRWTAMSTLDLGDLAGPFLSYTLHTDVERDDAPLWHTSRRGVLDIRTGRPATLASVAERARADVERRRELVLRSTLDSVRASRDERGARAASMLPFYRLDPASFSVTTLDGAPAVAYALPGAGSGDAGHLLALAPIPIGEPEWWGEASKSLPVGSVDGTRQVWRPGRYEVLVRYDPLSSGGRLSLRDSTSREWSLGPVPSPAQRILWLDYPQIDSASRHALARAFDESSLYDDAVRTASFRALPPQSPRHRVTRSGQTRDHHRPRLRRPPPRGNRA